MRQFYLILISVISLMQATTAQISWNNQVSMEVEVCRNSELFTINFTNESNATLTGISLSVDLPPGMVYESSSLQGINGPAVSEQNVSDANQPVFNIGNLAVNDSVEFSIELSASVATIAHQNGGGIFRNNYDLQYTGGNDTHEGDAYNVLYPALSILSVSPSAQAAVSGATVTRQINIVNAGFGPTASFDLHDNPNAANLTLTGSNYGVINAQQNKITLGPADFMQIGNFDGLFDLGESIVVEETLTLSGCDEVTVSSTIHTSWGCDGQVQNAASAFANVTIEQELPNIKDIVDATANTCFGSETGRQTLAFANTGLGVARNLELEIFKSSGGAYDQDIFSSFDLASFTYSIGAAGSHVAFTPQATATRNDGPYSCLGASPIGQINYAVPFALDPGDTLYVYWDIAQCCISACLDQGNMGWKYGLTYQDFCLNNSYSISKTGEDPTELRMSLFSETPADVDDGEVIDFHYYVSVHDNNLPVGPGAHYTLEFELPTGLAWSGNAADLTFYLNNTFWAPSAVNYNASTRMLTADYPLPAPFLLEKSSINLKLTGDCTNGTAGNQDLNLDIFYTPDTTCTGTCRVEMVCDQIGSTDLHCPITNCEGLHYYAFEVARTNFGAPDNNLDGTADASGSLNMNEVMSNRIMFGDTLQTKFFGHVQSQTNTTYDNLFAESVIEKGNHLEPVSAEVTIYDASANTSFTCDAVTTSYFDNSGNRVFRYGALQSNLAASCPAATNYTFAAGDSVVLSVSYRVILNLGGAIEELDIDNSFFLSQLSSPWSSSTGRFGCDNYNGRYTLIGYYFSNTFASNFNMRSCTKTVKQDFGLSIGDCCDNFGGGNLFPYEYRHWGFLESMQITIPNHYQVVRTYVQQKSTKATNQTTTQTTGDLTPTGTSPVTLDFDLSGLYSDQGGPLKYSDDGFHGTVFLELAPTCDVAINTFEPIDWKFKYGQVDQLGGGTTPFITSQPDQIKYNPTNLTLISSNPMQDGIGRTVTWNLKVKNATNNSDASNAWVHFQNPSGSMEIVSVVASNGDTLPLSGDIYQLGQINRNGTTSLNITASYGACTPDYIVAYAGYECSAYPDSFAYFTCPYTTYPLHVSPKEAGYQVRIQGTTVGDPCSGTIELSTELANVKFGHLDNIEIDVLPIGNSIQMKPATSNLLYPLSGSYEQIAEPSLIGSGYRYKLEEVNTIIHEDGLVGVTNLSRNTFKLKFEMELGNNFEPGHYVLLQFNATAICGEVLPTVLLAFDPSVGLTKALNTGLTDNNTDTWGVAWVDYDNDGLEDCFVSSYDKNTPNKMYRNNGDGTFTNVQLGSLTSIQNNSVSSTWADADNDGDLDVFLANNVEAANMYFQNDGNGNFSYDPNHSLNNYGGYCHNATWVDYDNDGWVDLFVTDFFATKFNLLYHNNGDGTFTAITNDIIATEANKSIGTTWGDYDNDGDVDAFVPNAEGANNTLYRNDGGAFTKITSGAIVNDGGNSVGSSWGDYNNDGFLDLFVANTGGQNNFLYQNNGDGSFTKITNSPITDDQHNSSGSSWVDVDNDGDLDLYVTNDLNDASVLYTNFGNGNFQKMENPLSEVQGNAYPNAWSDLDNDGDMDLFIGTRSNEKDVVFLNTKASCNSWGCFNLVGSQSNRSAIGAKIRVKANIYGNDVWQLRELNTQSGGGAGSQNGLKTLFGLGDATAMDSVIIEWPSGIRQTLTNVAINGCQDLVEPTGNLVCGILYNDLNENCAQDPDEKGIPNVMLEILPGPRYVNTDAQGSYSIYLEDGDYSVRPLSSSNWSAACPASTQVDLSLNGADQCGTDFYLTNGCTSPDLAVQVGTTVMRRGFQNQLLINYHNYAGTTAPAPVLYVEMHEAIIPISADLPWDGQTVNDTTVTYFWNLADVEGFTSHSIQIVDSVDVYAELGSTVFIKAFFDDANPDCDLTNNEVTDFEEIVGSVDPNDKLVYPGSQEETTPIDVATRLRYKIRFQNVGNYYASRVVITDQLSEWLDISTLKFESMSHPFNTHIKEGKLTWEVHNIILPDSSEDLAGSQGFVEFTISPLPNTPHLSLIHNQANIQFDYNDPIVTNTVSNQVVDVEAFRDQPFQIWLQPNPGVDQVQVYLIADEIRKGVQLVHAEIIDVHGKTLAQQSFSPMAQLEINTTELAAGVYHIRVQDELGRWTSSVWVKQ